MTPEDTLRLAERLHRTADLLTQRGSRAFDLAAQWKDNLRAASLEPSYGGSGDPTGTTATARADRGVTPLNDDTLLHARMRAAVQALDFDCALVANLVLQACPTPPRLTKDDTGPGDGYCQSCWRDGRYMEPEATHRDGRVMYRGSCSWCWGFTTEHGQRPPVSLLKLRHAGRRITTRDVANALGRKGVA